MSAVPAQWSIRTWRHMDPAVVQMAIEHRQMHAETFAYLMHALPYDQKIGARGETGAGDRPGQWNPMVEVSRRQGLTGSSPQANLGWDNEYARP